MPSNLIQECVQRSIELLEKNIDNGLLLAASPTQAAKQKHYTHLFARDLGVCSLGMVLSEQKQLIKIVKQSLIALGRNQTAEGQIPNHLDIKGQKPFFYYLGCIDATLWWLIAIDFYTRQTSDNLKKRLAKKIKKAFSWLACQDTNQDGLLEQAEASDWADVMPYNGAVLYTNVLWYYVLHQFDFKKKAQLALSGLNTIFCPQTQSAKLYLDHNPYGEKIIKALRANLKSTPYYLPYVSFKYSSARCDVYGNLLAILAGVARRKEKKIISYLLKQKINRPYPAQVLTPPIKPKDNDWRPYLTANKSANYPYGYHNGGIWPFVGGFWVVALAKSGRRDEAWRELEKLALANKLGNWQFNEWLDGRTGQAKGMAGQSWNAGAFLFAYYYLSGRKNIF